MKRSCAALLSLALPALLAAGPLQAQPTAAADTGLFGTPRLISKQFKFTEGPAVDRQGNVFFTDQPNNRIWKYSTDGKLSIFMEPAGRANGMYFDRKGNLVACADEHDQLWSISRSGKVKVLVTGYRDSLLNGPNDVWVAPDGGIYFTDPYYQRDYWTRKSPDMKEQNVYYLAPGSAAPVAVARDIVKPNGIVGTPDGRWLYVADIEGGKIYRYSIGRDGRLSDRQLFTDQGCDGMTLDSRGNLYLAGKGVTIYNPQGLRIGHIPIPEPWSANVCFAGKDRDQLFVTASTAVYIVPMKVKGVK